MAFQIIQNIVIRIVTPCILLLILFVYSNNAVFLTFRPICPFYIICLSQTIFIFKFVLSVSWYIPKCMYRGILICSLITQTSNVSLSLTSAICRHFLLTLLTLKMTTGHDGLTHLIQHVRQTMYTHSRMNAYDNEFPR